MKSRFFTFCLFFTVLADCIFAQVPMRPAQGMRPTNRFFFPERKKPNSAQKKFLQPGVADLTKYAAFLRQPKTGIFRLLPDPGCEENANVIRADKKCLEAIPESSFYSFREREHTAQYLSDIRLKNDQLITDGILAQSFLVAMAVHEDRSSGGP